MRIIFIIKICICIRGVVKRTRLSTADDNVVATTKIMEEYRPENKELQKLLTAERELLYQMTQNKSAVSFYEAKTPGFYDDIYRTIANFVIEYAANHEMMDDAGLLALLESSDLENKERIIRDLVSIYSETHPKICTDELLNNLLETIEDERKRISEEDVLSQSLEGKSELEKARIINEFNRRMVSKK